LGLGENEVKSIARRTSGGYERSVKGSLALGMAILVAAAGVACLKLPVGGPSDGGSGGSSSTGGSGSGGWDSDVPVCAKLFEGACEQPSYEYYLQLCENEDSNSVADILDCVVPQCLSTADQAPAECIQLAVEDEQNAYVSALIYDLESLCGSQLDNAQVRVVAIHAACIDSVDRLEALTSCLSGVYCNQITDCLTDEDVAPWWED
jgi:hypothetical protein